MTLLHGNPSKRGKGHVCRRTVGPASRAPPPEHHGGADARTERAFSPQLLQQDTYPLREEETSDRAQGCLGHHRARLRTAVGRYEIIRLVISARKRKERRRLYIHHSITLRVLNPLEMRSQPQPAGTWEPPHTHRSA